MSGQPQTARYAEFVQALLNLKGGSEGRYLGDLMGVVPLLDPTERQNRWLTGHVHYAGSGFMNLVAGQYTWCRLRNPLGSDHIAVVEAFEGDQAFALKHGPDSGLGALPAGGVTTLDARSEAPGVAPAFDGTGHPACRWVSGNSAGVPAGRAFHTMVAAGRADPIGLVLIPGTEFSVYVLALATAMNVVTFRWYERQMLASEYP